MRARALALLALIGGGIYTIPSAVASAAPVRPMVTVANTVTPVIDSAGLHFYGKTIPPAILSTLSPTAVRSAEASMAGQQVAEPADGVNYSAIANWSDTSIAFIYREQFDWVNAVLSGAPLYPAVRVPGEYSNGTGPNTPLNDLQLAHDTTTDQYFLRYTLGYSWPNTAWIGVQMGVGGAGPVLGFNNDPGNCPRTQGYCPVETASAGGLGPNEQVDFQCMSHHNFRILNVGYGYYMSAGLVNLQDCPITFYEASGRLNQADTYYSDVGLCN